MISQAILSILAIVLAAQQTLPLKRYEVIRVNSDGLRRLPESVRSIFVDPVPDGTVVDNLEEATKRVGFTPRLISGKTPEQLFITQPVRQEAKVSVTALTAALRDAQVQNVNVPASWDGVYIWLEQRPGILADYGDFVLAQAAPSTLLAPADFPISQFFEVLFRAMGINATDARSLREKFAANPAVFFPIATRYDMDIRQIPMTSGTGLLLQNADKGGELAFMWSTGDRSYFLTGLVTEDQAIAIGKSLQ
jgi:hypothetical protein